MESYQNNRLVRKYYNCTKCREYDTKLVNPFTNHIYCSKCGSLLSEIPENKYKKLKLMTNQNIFNRNEEDNKIPYKIKDNNYNKKYNKEKKEDRKIKKEKKSNKEKKYNNRHQSTSHYSDINMNFYNDDNNNNYNINNNINNNYNRNNNYNNINRININQDNDEDNLFNNHNNYNNFNNNRNFNNYNNNNNNHNYHNSNNNRNYSNHNFNNYNNINNESQEQRHRHNRRGHSMSNPPLYQNRNNNHNNNNNSNNFFANFFADDDFSPFNDTFFSNSPFRITIHRQPISHDIFDPMFSSFGSFFNGFFQDNFSSNFRSNIAGDFFSQILSILERNQAEANKNKHPPASDTALKKLKKFNMNEKYCKKDNKGKIELPNCCICLTEIQKGEKTVLLPCGHMFHWKCCLTWLKKNNTCPMCRFEIK